MNGGWKGALIFGAGALILGSLTFWSLPTATPKESLVGVFGTAFLAGCSYVCAKHGSSDL